MAEYASNYIAFLQVARSTGAVVEVIPNDEVGQTSVQALREMLDARVKLVAITHVPTNGGLVNPAAEIGAAAHEADALYLLDACQSIGQFPVNVQEIGCDMLSVTGRKYLRGPRGTGFLYVRREAIPRLEPPFLDLHAATWIDRDHFEIRADARRFENWETNVAGKIGLGVAIDYALSWGIGNIWARVSGLADELRARLGAIPGVTILDQGVTKCGIVSFIIDGTEPADVKNQLLAQKINTSVSTMVSTRLEMEARRLESLNRASVHYYNTHAEIEAFCEVVAGL
jgi:selenocysteine lyase/cysteine desulfurase